MDSTPRFQQEDRFSQVKLPPISRISNHTAEFQRNDRLSTPLMTRKKLTAPSLELIDQKKKYLFHKATHK